MSKSVRWQIPFVSTIDKTHYRVDIYDEGTFTPVQLTAGPSPFVTSEDSSEDFFAPVRTQTGTLQVCTKIPSGGTLSLNDILPANNIDRPVRLVSIAANNTETIEWQGFLSCEAYNQDYVGIPQILDIPVISVLEAMDSVPLNQLRSHGLVRVREALKLAMDEIMLQSGMDFYTYVNHSTTSYQILNKYIDQTIFFEQKEYNNENSTTYIVSGLSAKKALEIVAKYMGWVVREQGTKIYFERMGEDLSTQEVDYLAFGSMMAVPELVEFTTKDLATDVAWRGTGHQRSVSQGAKSVEVVAKLERYDVEIGLPEFPYSDTSTFSVSMRETDGSSYGNRVTIGSIISTNVTFSNICEFQSLQLSNDKTTGTETIIENVISEAIINPSSQSYESNNYVGSFMARIKKDNGDYENGLFISTIGFGGNSYVPSLTNYVFLIRSLQQYTFANGKFRVKFDGLTFYGGDTGRCVREGAGFYVKTCAIKFGNKYWNGQSWHSQFTTIDYNPLSDDEGYIIPVTSRMTGELVVMIYPNKWGHIIPADYEQGYELGGFLTTLDVKYESEESDTLTDRGENHYFRLLDTNFRDEISISTELASNLNNLPSPSQLMDNSTTPMTTMDYLVGGQQFSESRRPEVDLLNRLADYYGAARQRLELEVAHPTAAPLPLLKLNGINDGKVYLPLSESRNWKADTSKLTCFETAEQPSES